MEILNIFKIHNREQWQIGFEIYGYVEIKYFDNYKGFYGFRGDEYYHDEIYNVMNVSKVTNNFVRILKYTFSDYKFNECFYKFI